MQEALRFYQQGRLPEASQKLEIVARIIPEDPPTWSAVILYSMLAFLQEKSDDTTKARITYKVVENLLGRVKGTSPESEVLATRLLKYGRQLKGQDRLQLLERFLPLASKTQGKAGAALAAYMIADVYVSLLRWNDAYEKAKEAIKLSRESGQLNLEVQSLLALSISCIFLNQVKEAESLLEEILPRIQGDSILKANVLAQFGLVHSALGREERSVNALKEADNLIDSLGIADLVARHHLKSAFAYGLLRKTEMAIKEMKVALGIFEKLNDQYSVAMTEGTVAQFYLGMGAFEEANIHASRAAEIYVRLGNRVEQARNMRIAGQSLAELNKVDEALKVLEKAMDMFVEEKDLNETGVTYWWTIGFLKKLGRLDDVRHSLLIALDANARIFSDKKVEVQIRSELATVCKELGLLSESLKEYEKLLGLYSELFETKGEILTLLNMANVYANLKDYENWVTALTIAERRELNLGDPKIRLAILENSARFFKEFGNMVDALETYQEGLRISQLVDKPTACFWLGAVGHFYLEIGEYTKALDCFERGFNLAKEIGDSISMRHHLHGMGFAFFKRQEYDDALRVSREALKIARTLKSKPGEESTLALVSLALMGKRDYEAALRVEKERLELAQISESPELSKRVYGILGYIYLQMGRYAEAVEAYKKAIEQTEFLRGKVEYDIHKTGFLAKELLLGISPYDGIVEALYNLYFTNTPNKMQLAEEALFFAEKSKARVGIEQLIRARADLIFGGIPLEILKELDNLSKQAQSADRDYERVSTGYRVQDEEIEKKARALEIAQEKYWSFVEKLRKEYPRFGLFWSGFVIPFGELSIMDGETIIVYKVDPYWVYAWVIKKVRNKNEILKFIRIPANTVEIEKIVTKLLLPFKKVKFEEFDINASSELFNKILKPVLDGVSVSKRLIIVPDGLLNYIPFELLVTETRCGNDFKKSCFLGDQFILSYYPSVNILNFNRRVIPQTLPARGSILAVGDPIYGSDDERIAQSRLSLLSESDRRQVSEIPTRGGRIRKEAQVRGYTFERLKHSGVEVLKVNEAFGNTQGSRDVLIGFDASESRVKSKDLRQFQYLHFAVHGILAYDVPYLKEPALVLAVDPDGKEDGFLTLSEIYGLKLSADLVTLSACETGLGLSFVGEGVIGLSRAFMNAGARAILVSLWKVSDESTALLMEEFYRFLAQGINKVEALKKAKGYLRKQGYENPYFWAPFILIGD
jgi:CHAT domain-containing protein/tetratricopeptide (TPR) repeat protein